MICDCVCYCTYFINVNKLYVHVCVLETAKHRFFAMPNPLSCSLMNKICLNQILLLMHKLYSLTAFQHNSVMYDRQVQRFVTINIKTVDVHHLNQL